MNETDNDGETQSKNKWDVLTMQVMIENDDRYDKIH
jgi:hypothetical protein